MNLGDISYTLGLNISGFEKNALTADAILTRLNLKMDETMAKFAAAGAAMDRFGGRTAAAHRPVQDMASAFQQLELPLQDTTQLLEDMSLPMMDVAGHFETMGNNAKNTEGPVKSTGNALQFMGSATFSVIGFLSPLIVALGVLGGALVAVTAVLVVFAVAMAGFAAVLMITFGALAAVGAGILALGIISSGGINAQQNLTNAQKQVQTATQAHQAAVVALQRAQLAGGPTHQFTATQLVTLHQAQANATTTANNLATAQKNLTAAQTAAKQPLALLVADIKQMVETLGKQAIPYVNQVASALIPLVPHVQAFGEGLMSWFGGRLPELMRLGADAIQTMANGFQRLGNVIGALVDDTLNHMGGQFEPLIAGAFNGVIDAIIGLINNLHNLSDWFVINLPRYGPIVSQVFSEIGILVQGAAAQLLRLSDWTVANWPTIVQIFQTTATVLQRVGDFVGFLSNHLNVVIPLIAILTIAWSAWNVAVGISNALHTASNVIHTIGNIIKVTTAIVTAIVTAAQWAWNVAMVANPIGLVIVGIAALIFVIVLLVTHWNVVTAVLNRVWIWVQQVIASHSWLQAILLGLVGPILFVVAHWNQVINILGQVWNWVNHVGDAFSALGALASGVAHAIGGAFSAFGTQIHDELRAVAHLIDVFDSAVDRLPGLSGFLPTNLEAFAAGGVVSRAAIVGEDGSGYPEYVIPTNPMHRGNALALTSALLGELGAMAGGGVIGGITDPILNSAHAAMNALGPIGGVGVAVVDHLITTVTDKLGSFFANFAGGGGATVGGNVMQWIMQAILLTGVPASWAGGLATIISRESGGNPNAINNWDINAARGDPSRGLMQTIGGTFNAYHWPGTSWDIFDPVANIAAGINYILHRYGSIGNVQQANPNLPPMGYDNGGVLRPGLTLAYNGTGRNETVLSGNQMDEMIGHLRAMRRKLLGQIVVNNNGPSLSASDIVIEATKAAFGGVA